MTRPTMIRRVVTGLDAAGKSTALIDGPVPETHPNAMTVWHTPEIPADNSGTADVAPPFTLDLIHNGGTVFMLCRIPPGAGAPMHATDTIDYLTIISGEITIELETGDVTLRPGDLCVDRGILHGWRNHGHEDAVYTVVTIPSLPVGGGRTG